ncbi:MAG: pilus assembly protein PilC [candidate division Zixibacteria bacterium DG_27]|nr:MAG: pilus assembly protein PilC [candidate division Zixibacteria bacterium DG_27]
MADYSYIVKDTSGNKMEGVVHAPSLDAAVTKLREQGHTIISVKDYAVAEGRARPSFLEQLSLSLHKIRTRVPLSSLVFFTRQLSTMFSAGLTIEKAINNLMVEESNRKFKNVISQMAADIKKGWGLSEAMEKHPGVFSSLYVALVKSGEVSGNLYIVLEELADYLEFLQDTRRKVISAMIYPLFVVAVLGFITTAFIVYVVPMFQDIYFRYGSELPSVTQLLITVSEGVRHNFFLSLFVLLVILAAFVSVSMTYNGRLVIDGLRLKIPVVGRLLTYSIMSKFARTFGMLMGAGVPVVDSMSLVNRVVENLKIKVGVSEATRFIKDGYSIAASMRKSGVFPSTLLSLAATGEETGEVKKMFTQAASFYDKQVDTTVTRLTSLITPVLIVLIAGVILFIVVAIYLPIFYLGSAFKRGMH